MTSPVSLAQKPEQYLIKVYEPKLSQETPTPFFGRPAKSDIIELYAVLHPYYTPYKALVAPVKGEITIDEFMIPSPLYLEHPYDKMLTKYVLQQSRERSKPMSEYLSILKPELIGLALGGVISLGLGIFALATGDTGLATIMAGPFLASILGCSLLLVGLKREKR